METTRAVQCVGVDFKNAEKNCLLCHGKGKGEDGFACECTIIAIEVMLPIEQYERIIKDMVFH